MTLVIALFQLIAGFVLLVWSADRLVAGASALARNLGVPSLIIGLVIIGFGTSAPELVVSGLASFEGRPALAIGNVLGSNVVNIALVLGVAALLRPMALTPGTLPRYIPILGLSMLLATGLMWDQMLSRIDGLILFSALVLIMGGTLIRTVRRGGHGPVATGLVDEEPASMATRPALIWTLISLITLSLAARVLVDGAVSLAQLAGISEAVIGLTILALGTGLPELAACVVSTLKQEDDLAIGNIIGSNIFNLLAVLGLAAMVRPMPIEAALLGRDQIAMYLITALLVLLAWRPRSPGRINRPAGAILCLFYLGYMGLIASQSLGGA